MSDPHHTPSGPRRSGRASLRWALLAALLLLALGALVVLALPTDQTPPPATHEAASPTRCEDAPGAYSVELSPVGDVCFRKPPRRIVTLDAQYNDMLVAFDRERDLIATGYEGNSTEVFYSQLPELKVDADLQRVPFIGAGLDKEALYAQRAEVHHIDPERLVLGSRWKRADVDEITQNVGPFFANRYSRENSYPGDAPYRYYTAWELAAKVGAVYQRGRVAEELAAIWQDMVRDIQARLPPEEARPRVGLVMVAKGGFTPFSLSREGFGTAHYRAVGARDAFAPIQGSTYADAGRVPTLDIEGLLSIDPDVLIMPFAIYPSYTQRFDELMKQADDPLAGRLKAMRERRVYPGGTPLQGPLFLIFQTEMAAKQLYPEVFGPWRAEQRYPAQEQLFDRARVARALRAGQGAP